jgi:hypothetical protein
MSYQSPLYSACLADFSQRPIMNALGELGFRHPLHIQRFENKCFVITNKICGYFMSEIGSLVTDAQMRPREGFSRLGSIFRSSDFSAQPSTQFFDLPFTFAEELRSRFFLSRVRDDHVFQSQINSRAIGNENLCGFFNETFGTDRNEPLTEMIGSKSCTFDCSFDLSTLNHLHLPELSAPFHKYVWG